ncbi:Deuterolysin metalloprotease family-domain-containing protein [Annulohypoxylon maeteangense]|uniref:Deuterolysin metalloprotease family-domain-containing protein n=1 Tax=Annulohypoxylon maeteangense TaxID=1927788 RepID=UPI0020082587|nr:Deuterolysin metalloprotease family-domain-containing protein [Annulohypoxylon maeteangense]KAI0882996.1 Deuterolysin metalloprotease family-domain-containing protein [Annulohypoxylon maeteangense]
MRYTEILLAAAYLAATIDAHILKPLYKKEASVLEVTLAPAKTAGVAELVATIKNVGSTDLNLLKVGTLLDENLPIQKVLAVDESGKEAQFKGIHTSIHYDALTVDHFHLLRVSESVSTNISAATIHDFTKSGTYIFTATGSIPIASAGSTTLSGPALIFQSNSVSLYVDAQIATAVPKALSFGPLEARTMVQDGCNATRLAASTAALEHCVTLALDAAADAKDPSSTRFVEYFKTNSSETRQIVADRLTAVSKECSTTNSGLSRYFCYDYYSICETEGPLNAYTMWDIDTVVMCPLFYDTLPPLPQACHRQDQATTTIHEISHCEEVYSPHTNDFAYGYNESSALTPERAVLNADNYSLFANAVYMKC